MSDTDTTTTAAMRGAVIRDMQAEVMAFCHAKGWAGPGSAQVTFGDTMALLHSEVSEALEAFRDHGLSDATLDHHDRLHGICIHGEKRGDCPTQPGLPKPEGVGSEFADVLIRLLDDCDRFGIDLAFEFNRKMAYNRDPGVPTRRADVVTGPSAPIVVAFPTAPDTTAGVPAEAIRAAAGQVWRENDSRSRLRTIRVDSVDGSYAYGVSLTDWDGAATPPRRTRIRIDSHGRVRGYRYERQADSTQESAR